MKRYYPAALLLSVCSALASAGPILNVDLNTAGLVGQPGSFALDFQLVTGGSTMNTAQISQFNFGSGVPLPGSASTMGGVTFTGSPLAATFSDAANFFNELILPFHPGNAVQFQANLSNAGSPTPDAFTIAILDNGDEIPMTNPDGALVEFDYTPGSPTVIASESDLSETNLVVTSSVTPESAAPELAGLSYCLIGFAALILPLVSRRLRRAKFVRGLVPVMIILMAAVSQRASAQYNVSVAVSGSTPRPGGGTFNPDTSSGGYPKGTALDGNNLVFLDDATNALWTLNTTTGTFHEIVTAGVTLPDGYGTIAGFGTPMLKLNTVAFRASNESGKEGLYTMPVSGGTLSRIADDNTPTPDGIGNFNFNFDHGGSSDSNNHISMDGVHIAFDPAGPPAGSYIANLDGSGLAPVAPNAVGVLCFIFNPGLFSQPVIWGPHLAFQGQNVFDDFWFFNASYPPGVVSPPVPACYAGGPLNYPATISPGAVLPGGVTAGTDNEDYGINIDDTQIYIAPESSPAVGVYSMNYDGTNIQPILDPSTTIEGLTPPYTVGSFSADSGSIAITVIGADGSAIYVYSNGKFHRVVGSGDVIGGVTVPFSPNRLGVGPYGLSGGNLTFALFNTAHYLAKPMFCADDMTAAVSVTRGGLRFDHATGQFLQTVAIRNTTSRAIAGPLELVVEDLPAGVSVADSSGTTACSGTGQPFLTLSSGGMAPGSTVTTTIAFHDPSFEVITWTPRILSGNNR